MTIIERRIDDDPERYEQRYTIRLGREPWHMCRRPVSIAPPDGWVGLVDFGPRHGRIGRYDGAGFKGGKWTGTKQQPTHWTEQENASVAAG